MSAINELKRLSNKIFIGGEFRNSVATEHHDVIGPATGAVIGRMGFNRTRDVTEASEFADRSHQAWNKVNA